MANFLYRDFRVVGIEDPVAYLACFLLMDQMALEGLGNPKRTRPQVEGSTMRSAALRSMKSIW